MNGLHLLMRNDSDKVRFELAGTLGGVDVESLHKAWQREAFTETLRPVTVDITSVTGVDHYGRALLVVMHRFGARIIANSPESSAIAQPIVNGALAAAISKPSWFRSLIRFLSEDRRPNRAFPARAEMMCLTTPAGRVGSGSKEA